MKKFNPSFDKKIAATLAIIVAVTTMGAASMTMAKEGKSHSRGISVEKLTEKLTLTTEQQAQVAAIIEEHKAEKAALREERKAQRDAFKTSISELLTEEQLAEFESMKKGKKGKKGHHDDKEAMSES